jgi:hypothetical protein
MRKLKRSIARARMEKEGIQHMNKKRCAKTPFTGRPFIAPSFFAENWREYSSR